MQDAWSWSLRENTAYWYTYINVIRKITNEANEVSSGIVFLSAFLSSRQENSAALSLKSLTQAFLGSVWHKGWSPLVSYLPLSCICNLRNQQLCCGTPRKKDGHCSILSTITCTAAGGKRQCDPMVKGIPNGRKLYAMKQNIFNYNPCCGLTLVGKLVLHRCSFTAPSTSCVVGEEKSKSKTEKTCGPRWK